MRRCFVDASVFYSAMYSSRGRSHDLLVMGSRGEVKLVVSKDVLTETRRNLMEKATELAVLLFDRAVADIPFEFVEPTKREVRVASGHVAEKDAHIVAAAKKADVDYLVTFDEKHLLGNVEVEEYLQGPVVYPEEAVAFIKLDKTGQEVFAEKYGGVKARKVARRKRKG